MAKGNGKQAELTAEETRLELERQRVGLQAELARVRTVVIAPADVDAYAAREGRRLALEAALADMAGRLAAVRVAADTEREERLQAEHVAKHAAAAQEFDQALVAAVALLPTLTTALAGVNESAARLRRAGGYDGWQVSAMQSLYNGVAAARAALAKSARGRELLGLPALPSAREQHVAELRANIARLKEQANRYRTLKLGESATEAAHRSRRDMLAQTLEVIALDYAALAELGESVPPVIARDVAAAIASLTGWRDAEGGYSGLLPEWAR